MAARAQPLIPRDRFAQRHHQRIAPGNYRTDMTAVLPGTCDYTKRIAGRLGASTTAQAAWSAITPVTFRRRHPRDGGSGH
jgi:hypothetical protein